MNLWNKCTCFVLVLIGGFLGGMVSSRVLAPKLAQAQTGQVLRGEQLFIVKSDGSTAGQIYTTTSGAVLNLNGDDQVQRLQLGTYDAAGEKGLPMIGLSDNKGQLRMLLRLAGSNEAPLIIFKDNQHRDRMIIGLGTNDPSEEPFIAYFDKDGNKHMLMGAY